MYIYWIIGWPIKHSLSPAMHNAAFKHLCIDAEYRAFEIRPEELEDFILNRKDVIGFNITIPYKIKAREILEKRFPLDEKYFKNRYYIQVTGAVNTVKRNGDKLEYVNTDVEGFVRSIEADLKFKLGDGANKNKNVLLIGCGGAGRAVIAGLSLDFVDTDINKIYVFDKSETAINATKEHFGRLHKEWAGNLNNIVEFISEKNIREIIDHCQLLVNASPLGMEEGDTSPISKELLHKDLFVYDVVYNRETQLVKDAKIKECKRAVTGKGMLLYQGVGAFEFWFPSVRPRPVSTMRKALDSALNKK